jgi:phospholipid/cholesterol/gamma-HCH transport system permease protein
VESSAFGARPLGGSAPATDDDEPDVTGADSGGLRSFLEEAGELGVFTAEAFRALLGTPRYFAECLRQAAIIVRGTSFLLLAMNVFLGISVANFGFFFLRSIGASDFTGAFTGLLTQRQTSVTMFGYVIAAKVCCGFAAELGAAKIQEEVDAYESTGVDTRQLIVGTRILAVLLFVPLATAISIVGQTLGNFLSIVVIQQGQSAHTFFSVSNSVQSVTGELYTMITVGAIGVMCAIVGCFYGLRAKGGPAGVGEVVARSLVLNLIIVHVVSALFGVIFYANHAAIPIAS